MVQMSRFYLPLLLAAAALAQNAPENAEKPPADVDAALRARATQFFQAEVDGKFHQAEQLVAEDSKDFFVGSSKPAYLSFEIKTIQFSDHFTRAIVFVAVSRLVAAEGFLGHPVPGTVPSRWKLENGQWCWYVDPADLRTSPFMPVPPGMPAPTGGLPTSATPAIPSRLPVMPTMGAAVAVKADRSAVEFKTGVPSSEQVTIVNPQPRSFTVSLVKSNTPGLTAKLDSTDLRAGGKIIVKIESNGSVKAPRQPVTIGVRVLQTNQLIPIKVSFAPPSK